jgi:hypothetical protein
MMKPAAILAACFLSLNARAQMGWTPQRCREHSGPEFMPANGDTHYLGIGE